MNDIKVYFSGTPTGHATYPVGYETANHTDKNKSKFKIVSAATYTSTKVIYYYVRYDIKTSGNREAGNMGIWIEIEGKQLKKEYHNELTNFFSHIFSPDSPLIKKNILSQYKEFYKFEIADFAAKENELNNIILWIRENLNKLFNENCYESTKYKPEVTLHKVPFDETIKNVPNEKIENDNTNEESTKDTSDQSLHNEGYTTRNNNTNTFTIRQLVSKYQSLLSILFSILFTIGYVEYRNKHINFNSKDSISIQENQDSNNMHIWEGNDSILYKKTESHHKYFLKEEKFLKDKNITVKNYDDFMDKLSDYILSTKLKQHLKTKDDVIKSIEKLNDKGIPKIRETLNNKRNELDRTNKQSEEIWINQRTYRNEKLFADILVFQIKVE